MGWIGTFVDRSTHISSSYSKQPGYAVNDFYVSYKGQEQLKGVTTTLVLGNAFDKEYWSPQGIPRMAVTVDFRELSVVIPSPRHAGATIKKGRDNESLHTLA